MNKGITEVKISMPLIDDIELQRIDNYYNDIVKEYTKAFLKEKEQVIAQRIMMNLQQENQQLKEQIEKCQLQNFNLKQDIMIKKISFPNKKIRDKSLIELYNMPSYEDLKRENQQLKEKYNEALKQLIRYNIPCEIDGFNEKDENIEYCSENCGVDDNIYFKCWDRFIEQELEKGDN